MGTSVAEGKAFSLLFTDLLVVSASPRCFLTSRIDFIALLLFDGQVNNRIH